MSKSRSTNFVSTPDALPSTPAGPRTPSDPETLDAELAHLEAGRLAQYRAIAYDVNDAVSRAHRESVLRALEEIRTARQRLSAGLYGLCTCCSKAIPQERLELMPSASMCVGCAVLSRAG
jgi:DnaK suppressor protein